MKFDQSESLHRLMKFALDSGEVSTLEAAESLFRGFRLGIAVSSEALANEVDQAALLTTVALASRVFLGGVMVSLPGDAPLQVPVVTARRVTEAVKHLGACCGKVPEDTPCLVIGSGDVPVREGFHIRLRYGGWSGGFEPVVRSSCQPSHAIMPLAPMLAAALAVNEAFLSVSGSKMAGRISRGLSLWTPDGGDWRDPSDDPPLARLPSTLWLIGLGHLGQAYLWALGLLPYTKDQSLQLVLQDIDIVTPSTVSTSILTRSDNVGQPKTRTMAEWAGGRGFQTNLLERRFDAHFQRHQEEPGVALCGLDNALGRRALDVVGFDCVIEAGIGRGHDNFRAIRLHTLPGPRSAAELWPVRPQPNPTTTQPAYQALLASQALDQCGVTLLAGKAVGAPFVGAVTACFAIAELLRHLHGGSMHEVIDLDLLSLEAGTYVRKTGEQRTFNPGYIDC